ncbi:MAG TPA: prolyl oligopeptidase family serine peptidase [Thermoanaerobaculia bacterium]|nr:prolyl oligopeptidase family serine peptidase [Thermoanaerobaculia bacterium]
MFPRVIAFVLVATAATVCSERPAGFLERSVTLGERTYKYRVSLPARYTRVRKWPVILYLHGSGERGDDNTAQLGVGLPPALQAYPDRYKCIVVIPQCRPGQEWYGEMESMALAALDKTMAEFRTDPRRVYLTGISMGGAGAWYIARHHRRFAAVVPIAGEVARQPNDPFPSDPPPDIALIVGAQDPYATLAEQIGNMPVWAFHGAKDDVVPVWQSQKMIAAIRARGSRAHYTEYPDAGHDCWDLAYANPDLVHWLLNQRMR